MHFLLSKCQKGHIKSDVNADKYSTFGDLVDSAVFGTCAISVLRFGFRQLYHITQCTLSNSDIR